MTTKRFIFIVMALALSRATIQIAWADDLPAFQKITLPTYPFLARLTGTEGRVQVDLTADEHCTITDIKIGEGPPPLVEAVKRTYSGSIYVEFQPCVSAHSRSVRILYTFTLQGDPTNRWSPTHVRVTSTDAYSYNIEITTTPADLKSLGLQKSRDGFVRSREGR